MNKILLTGFEPFGGEKINPAQEALRLVKTDAIKLYLPVEYDTAAHIVIEAIDLYKPCAVINIGQAGGRDGVTPEKYAVNLRNAKAPDNAGRLCTEEKILPGGPDRLESSFGAEAITKALLEADIRCSVSVSAGTYVCNDVMYQVLWKLKDTRIPAGFIHLPYCLEQLTAHPDAFGMDLNLMAKAIEIAAHTVMRQI